jgi:hypothetical protein
MVVVYCEHLDDREEIKSNDAIYMGSDIDLIRNQSADETISQDNYAGDNDDPVGKYLDFIGGTKALAFTCPICRELNKNPTVYFLADTALEVDGSRSFVRLRLRPEGMFYWDNIDEVLSEESMLAPHGYVSE